MAPVLIISPLFPPLEGGLPDHTDHLATALTSSRSLRVLTSTGVTTDRPFQVEACVGRWNDPGTLLATIEKVHPEGPILWQYVPHMYGRGGVNPGIPRVMQRLSARSRRQLVLAHEIAAPLSFWPHRLGYAVAHRLMWRRLLGSVQSVGISTEAWLDTLTAQARRDSARLFLAPSPSNLPVTPVPPDWGRDWRMRHHIPPGARVVGFFGSPGSGKQFDWVLAAWRALRERDPATTLVCVGGRPAPALSKAEAACFHPLGYLGRVPASEALHAMDLLVLPFVDGVSERRSSYMAALAHGKPVITTHGPATGRTLRTAECHLGVTVEAGMSALASETARIASDPEELIRLGERARRFYASQFDWPRLADRVLAHLD